MEVLFTVVSHKLAVLWCTECPPH